MLCPADKRRCCNTACVLVSHQHRSHGYNNPFRRATINKSCPVCEKKSGHRASALGNIADRAKTRRQASLVAFLGPPRKTRLEQTNLTERRPPIWVAKGGPN